VICKRIRELAELVGKVDPETGDWYQAFLCCWGVETVEYELVQCRHGSYSYLSIVSLHSRDAYSTCSHVAWDRVLKFNPVSDEFLRIFRCSKTLPPQNRLNFENVFTALPCAAKSVLASPHSERIASKIWTTWSKSNRLVTSRAYSKTCLVMLCYMTWDKQVRPLGWVHTPPGCGPPKYSTQSSKPGFHCWWSFDKRF
jgi:hypothetical protein